MGGLRGLLRAQREPQKNKKKKKRKNKKEKNKKIKNKKVKKKPQKTKEIQICFCPKEEP
jgi:hypothetical protein